MDAKLTLKMDKAVINEAKEFARRNNTSLSKMVERFFVSIIKEEKNKKKIAPVVKELSGIIALDEGADYKKDHRNYLEGKYK